MSTGLVARCRSDTGYVLQIGSSSRKRNVRTCTALQATPVQVSRVSAEKFGWVFFSCGYAACYNNHHVAM